VVVLFWRYLHELSGHEDGVLGKGWTSSHPKRCVNRFPQDRV
jgi:hypothetical protein